MNMNSSLLSQWSRVLEKMIVVQLVKEPEEFCLLLYNTM
jgi:hypothetical protein